MAVKIYAYIYVGAIPFWQDCRGIAIAVSEAVGNFIIKVMINKHDISVVKRNIFWYLQKKFKYSALSLTVIPAIRWLNSNNEAVYHPPVSWCLIETGPHIIHSSLSFCFETFCFEFVQKS